MLLLGSQSFVSLQVLQNFSPFPKHFTRLFGQIRVAQTQESSDSRISVGEHAPGLSIFRFSFDEFLANGEHPFIVRPFFAAQSAKKRTPLS